MMLVRSVRANVSRIDRLLRRGLPGDRVRWFAAWLLTAAAGPAAVGETATIDRQPATVPPNRPARSSQPPRHARIELRPLNRSLEQASPYNHPVRLPPGIPGPHDSGSEPDANTPLSLPPSKSWSPAASTSAAGSTNAPARNWILPPPPEDFDAGAAPSFRENRQAPLPPAMGATEDETTSWAPFRWTSSGPSAPVSREGESFSNLDAPADTLQADEQLNQEIDNRARRRLSDAERGVQPSLKGLVLEDRFSPSTGLEPALDLLGALPAAAEQSAPASGLISARSSSHRADLKNRPRLGWGLFLIDGGSKASLHPILISPDRSDHGVRPDMFREPAESYAGPAPWVDSALPEASLLPTAFAEAGWHLLQTFDLPSTRTDGFSGHAPGSPAALKTDASAAAPFAPFESRAPDRADRRAGWPPEAAAVDHHGLIPTAGGSQAGWDPRTDRTAPPQASVIQPAPFDDFRSLPNPDLQPDKTVNLDLSPANLRTLMR